MYERITGKMYITCGEVDKIVPFDCCNSCHDDWEVGYGGPHKITVNGKYYEGFSEVCCDCPELTTEQFNKVLLTFAPK